MDMRFETWIVRNIYISGSLNRVARELVKYKLDVLGVQEVILGKVDTEPADNCTISVEKLHIFCGNGNPKHQLGPGFLINEGITSAFMISTRWCKNLCLTLLLLTFCSYKMTWLCK
jgi:hypothetical protein